MDNSCNSIVAITQTDIDTRTCATDNNTTTCTKRKISDDIQYREDNIIHNISIQADAHNMQHISHI